MANPTVQAQGAMTSTTSGPLTPAWSVGHAANDIGLLYVSSASNTAPTLSTPAGFALLTSTQPNNGSNLYIYWCRATSAAQASPTIATLASTMAARIVVIRGCVTTGNPWEMTAVTNSGGSSPTTYASLAGSVLSGNSLVMTFISTHQTVATAPLSTGPTNASETSLTTVNNSAQPAGASEQGFIVISGLVLVPGSSGSCTGNLSGAYANSSIAISFPNQFLFTSTPTVGALTLTGAAPTVVRKDTITPGSGSLVLTGNPLGVPTIPTGSLVLTGAAPTIIRGIVPSATSLLLTGAAPVLTQAPMGTYYRDSARLANRAARLGAMELGADIGIVITPATGSLTLTGVAPVVTQATPPTAVIPATGSLVLTGAAPVVTRQDSITSATGVLVLTGAAPVATRQDNITPVAGSLTLAGIAPILSLNSLITPNTGALTLSGVAPVMIQGAIRVPATGALVLTGAAPLLIAGTGITPNTGSLVLTGAAPVVTQQFIRIPTSGSLGLTGAAPALDSRIVPNTGSLTIAGVAPVVIQGTIITPNTGSLVLTGIAPVIIQGMVLVPAAGSLILTGQTATVAPGIVPSAGALTLSGIAPVVIQGVVRVPLTGALILTGAAPALDSRIVPTAGTLVLNGNPAVILGQGVIQPATGTLTLTGAVPALGTRITPNSGALTLTGAAPVVTQGIVRVPSTGALTLAAPPTSVQSVVDSSVYSATTGLTVSATITGVRAGSTIIAFTTWDDTGNIQVSGVNDGSAYASFGTASLLGARGAANASYLQNVAAGSHTVVATFSSAAAWRAMRLVEVRDFTFDIFSGVSQFSVTSGNTSVVGFTTPMSVYETDLAWWLDATGTTAPTVGPGYTSSATNSTIKDLLEFRQLTDSYPTPFTLYGTFTSQHTGPYSGFGGLLLGTSGYAPALSQGTTITPNTGVLALAGAAPVVTQGTVRVPNTGALTLSGAAPVIVRQDTITPTTGTLVLSGVAPVVLGQGVLQPSTGALTLAGNAPAVTQGMVIRPSTGMLRTTQDNLLIRSSEYENAAWTTELGISVTPNAATAPDGTLTADHVIPTATNSVIYQSFSTLQGEEVESSVHFHTSSTLDSLTLYMVWLGGPFGADRSGVTVTIATQATVPFNLGIGVVPTVSVVSKGNGWYRLTLRAISPGSGASTLTLRNLTTPDGVKYLRLWGEQASLLPGNDYTGTTYAPAGKAPVIVYTATPNTGALSLAGLTPVVTQQFVRVPTAGSLVLTGAAPGVTRQDTVQPNAGSLVLSGSAPVLTAQGPVQPGTGTLALTGAAPVVTLPLPNTTITTATGSLVLSGKIPTSNVLAAPTSRATWVIGNRMVVFNNRRETTIYVADKSVLIVAPLRPARWILDNVRRLA